MSEAARQGGRADGRLVHATPRPTVATQVFLRVFGPLAGRHIGKYPDLGVRLAKARNPLVPVSYLANAYGRVAVAVVVGLAPLVLYLALSANPAPRLLVPLFVLPMMLGVMVYSFEMLRPDLQIKARRRNLESNLPYALNFMAALSSAGVVPNEVFGALGQQDVYGEVAREAAWIHRDTKVFSRDLVSALQAAARRSPSQQFEEFLQGSLNTITSGGDLKTYFLAKSEQFTQDNRRRLKGFLESMGVMAESYVVVAAAAPLFLIVILSVMTLLSKGTDPTFMLNILILLCMPVIHAMFAYILRTMRAD
jgi:archaeal flagellar protein FlaJ